MLFHICIDRVLCLFVLQNNNWHHNHCQELMRCLCAGKDNTYSIKCFETFAYPDSDQELVVVDHAVIVSVKHLEKHLNT